MVSAIDIYRSAQVLIEKHGADAASYAAMRADELLAAGDDEGERVWKRIVTGIEEMMMPHFARLAQCRESILASLARFDAELREQPGWANWQENRAQKYAVSYDGKLYPPKHTLHLAMGTPKATSAAGCRPTPYSSA